MYPAKDGGAERKQKPGLECLWDPCANPGLPSTGIFFFNIRKKINPYEFPPVLYWGFCYGQPAYF